MSWFTEFAGKAEEFLNKIDENAANALNQAAAAAERRNNTKGQRVNTTVPVAVEDHTDSVISRANNDYQPDVRKENYGTSSTDAFNSNGYATTSEEWNSANPIVIADAVNGENSQRVQSPLSKSSNVGKESAKKSGQQQSRSKSRSKPEKASMKQVSSPSVAQTVEVSSFSNKEKDDKQLFEFLNDPTRKELDETLVLQTELANQAREVEMLYKGNKALQSENEKLKQELAVYEGEESKEKRLEELVLQLQQSESTQRNLERLLLGKDEEVAKLKNRLDEHLEKLQQLEVLQQTQHQLENAELEKQKLTQTNDSLIKESKVLEERLQASAAQCEGAKLTNGQLEAEYSTYKEKAKSVLKQKDDLISSLQDGTSARLEDFSGENPLRSEINALKSERELLTGEIAQARSTTDSLREEANRLEAELSNARSTISQIQKQVSVEQALGSALQDENLQLRQQLSTSQFELDVERSERRKLEEWKTKAETEDVNHNQNEDRVSSVVPSRGRNGVDSEEALRMRITALSQSLLEKQSLINTLSSEKQLFQINVERLQEQLGQMQSDHTTSSNSSGFTQTVISSRPLYLSESPWDSGVSTRVKRAFSSIDTMCCQAGLTLRRRPNLRLGFFVYIVILHFWVLFILVHFFNHVPDGHHTPNNTAP